MYFCILRKEDDHAGHQLAIPERAEEGAEGVTVSIRVVGKSVIILFMVGLLAAARVLAAPDRDALPRMGPAPDFTLTAQDGHRMSLEALRGKVVAITFIYASCADTCPLLTAKMATVQKRLGADFGPQVSFVSVTVDPERDTSTVLASYARSHGINGTGWAFLTGTPQEIRDVAKRYGIYYKKSSRGDVDHTFLTSLVDRAGVLRVQYLGVRFDPEEFLRDVKSLMREETLR